MSVPASALWLLQLASRPWLRWMAAATLLACCWPRITDARVLLLLACFLDAPFGVSEQLQALIGGWSRAGRHGGACRCRRTRRAAPAALDGSAAAACTCCHLPTMQHNQTKPADS